jgi:hypothetical protein
MHQAEPDGLPREAGTDQHRLRREDFVALFADFLDTQLYAAPRSRERKPRFAPEAEYISNRAFWTDALSNGHYDGRRVRLKDFTLLEWIPLSPGRYFTDAATEKRNQAEQFYAHSNREYLPLGKLDMILGGVGSLRLGSRPAVLGIVHVVGLSSSGVSHEGIPALLNEQDHFPLIRQLRTSGAVIVDAVGTLRSMPLREWRTWRTDGVPTMYLSIEEIDIRRSSRPVLATVSIMFPSPERSWSSNSSDEFQANGYSTRFSKSWSYASFDPLEGPEGLKRASKWLEDYARRYSGTQEPAIFSDFDEIYPHFESPVEFPLSDAALGTIDAHRLAAYSRHYEINLNIHELRLGDTFSDVTNATIINRSGVINSLNGLPSDNAELRPAIMRVVDFINRSGNRSAAKQFEALIEEVEKRVPETAVLSKLWTAVITELPGIQNLTGVAEKMRRVCSN